MLSEDYFGFQNQKHPLKGTKKLRRTELSNERLQIKKSGGFITGNKDIEQLRNKYNAINSRNNQKKARKSKALSLSPNNFCYHSMKLKYLHYKQEWPSDRYREIRKQFQKKILARNFNKPEPYFSRKNVGKQQLEKDFKIPNLMGHHLGRSRHQEDFSGSSLNKVEESSSKKIIGKSGVSKNSISSTYQMMEVQKLKQPKKISEPTQYLARKEMSSKDSYMLGICTLKKDDDYIQESPEQHNIRNEESQSLSQLLQNGLSDHKFRQSNASNNMTNKLDEISEDEDRVQNANSFSISSKQQNLKPPQYRISEQYSGSSERQIISDYEKIKMLEQQKKQSIVQMFKKSLDEESSYHIKIHNESMSNQLSFADPSQNSKHQGSQKNQQTINLQPKIYNNSRIIHNQSNVSANQSSFCYRMHDFGVANQNTFKQSQKMVQYTPPSKISEKRDSIIQQKFSQNSQSKVYGKLSSKISNGNSLLSQIIGSSERPIPKPIVQEDHDIYQTGTFLELGKGKKNEDSTGSRKNQFGSEQVLQSESSGLSKIIENKSPSPFTKQYDSKSFLPTFNLVESIRFINNYQEENLFGQNESSSKQLTSRTSKSSNEKVEEIINGVLDHLEKLNTLGEFVKMKDEVYENDSGSIYEVQSFLLFRKFLQERKKVIKALEKCESSIFRFNNGELSRQSLKRYCKDSRLLSLITKINECNSIIEKTLGEYRDEIMKKSTHLVQSLEIAPLSKKDINKLMGTLDQELEMLISKFYESKARMNDPQEIGQQAEVISIRAFSLMEVVFLLSEIQGRKVKNLETGIEGDNFEMYLRSYKDVYDQTIRFFQN